MRIVLIGGGQWGRNYIRELSSHLIAVVEPDKETATKLIHDFDVRVWNRMPPSIEFNDYDAAIICTPPDTHVELAYPILKEGKCVLIEKPLATSVEELLKLKNYKDKIMVGHIYLHHPEVENLRTNFHNIPIDHIFTRRTNNGPIRNWQNALWDLAPHDISICNYILGQNPIGVLVRGTRDWAMLHLSYIACEAIIYVSWLGGPKTRLVELVPVNQDRIIFDDMKVVLERSPMRRMLDDFMTGNWDERCSYEAGMEVVNVLEKCYV